MNNHTFAKGNIYLFYLFIYTAPPSLLGIMRRAAWGGGKPGHMSAFPGYACETSATGRRQLTTYIQTDFFHINILSLAGLEPVRNRYVA